MNAQKINHEAGLLVTNSCLVKPQLSGSGKAGKFVFFGYWTKQGFLSYFVTSLFIEEGINRKNY